MEQISLYIRIKDLTKQGLNSAREGIKRFGQEIKSGPLKQLGKGFVFGAALTVMHSLVNSARELAKAGDFRFFSKESLSQVERVASTLDNVKKKIVGIGISWSANVIEKIKTTAGFLGALSTGVGVDKAAAIAKGEGTGAGEGESSDPVVAEENYFEILKKRLLVQMAETKNKQEAAALAKKYADIEKQIADNKERHEKEAAAKRQAELDAWAARKKEIYEQDEKFLENEKDRIETNRDLALDAIDKQVDKLEDIRDSHKENYETLRREVTDKDFRKQKEQEAKDEQRENKRFNKVLARAHSKLSRRGFKGRLNAEERLALGAEAEAGKANAANREIKNQEAAAEALRQKADNAIIKIEQKIDQLLAFK